MGSQWEIPWVFDGFVMSHGEAAQEEGVPAFTQLLVPKEYKAWGTSGKKSAEKKGLTREKGDLQ